MTSSLVGSEMCIRDRELPLRESQQSQAPQDQPVPPPMSASDTQQLIAPVSYTHLTLPTICSV
eukprot:1091236-Prorocentrum_lima.AAC.1